PSTQLRSPANQARAGTNKDLVLFWHRDRRLFQRDTAKAFLLGQAKHCRWHAGTLNRQGISLQNAHTFNTTILRSTKGSLAARPRAWDWCTGAPFNETLPPFNLDFSGMSSAEADSPLAG